MHCCFISPHDGLHFDVYVVDKIPRFFVSGLKLLEALAQLR